MASPLRVLILEDRPSDALLIVSELRRSGYDVEWERVASGPDYLAKLGTTLDIILADYTLPQFDAIQALRILADRRMDIPLVVVTGSVGEEAAVECLKQGAVDYLLKDRLARLGSAVDRALKMKLARQERQRAEVALQESNRLLQNALEELKATQLRIIQQERLRALGEMASGVAHDFNNVLAMIAGTSELPLVRPTDLDDREKMREYLQLINGAAMNAANIVGRLREFYRPRDDNDLLESIDVNRLIEQVLSLTEPRWKSQALARGAVIDAQTSLQSVPVIAGRESDLREMLTNVVFNAVDAMPRGGILSIRTHSVGSAVAIDVEDTGTGMTEDVRRRCLEPFFTTKGKNGSGLGLAMVYGVVQRHGGTIEIDSELDRGTTLHFRIPTGPPPSTPQRRPDNGAPRTCLRILVVEDEAPIRRILSAYLAVDHHHVETASGGYEALARFRANHFDIVVTDRAMPDMSGDQLAQAIKQLSPDQPIILLTGFGDIMLADGTQPEAVDLVAPKPVSLAGLRAAISLVLRS